MEYSKSFPLVENIIKETLIYEGRVLHKWHLPQFQVGDFQACTFSHPNNSRNHVNNIIISYLELSNGNLHNYFVIFFNNTLNQQLTEWYFALHIYIPQWQCRYTRQSKQTQPSKAWLSIYHLRGKMTLQNA